MRLLLDASTALAAVLPDEDSTFARAAVATGLRDGLVVPALWLYEIQNAVLTALRRERIDRTTADEVLEALRALDPDIEPPHGLGREVRLATTYNLTAYDAAYLSVALDTGAVLATSDRTLRQAAERIGVPCFQAASE